MRDLGCASALGDLSDLGRASALGNLTDLGQLGNLGELADLGQLDELGRASALGEIDDLGRASALSKQAGQGSGSFEYFIQAVDGAGNVALALDGGTPFSATSLDQLKIYAPMLVR